MDLLTTSRMRAWQACPRMHFYRYEQCMRPVGDDGNLRFGSLVHAGLAAWWLADAERLPAALRALAAEEADPFDRVRAEELLRGYDARWGDEPLTVVLVELEFTAKLKNPETGAASRTFSLAGKLDAGVVDDLARSLIVEHKTSSEDIMAGSEYWRRLTLDPQVSTYYEGFRALGHEPAGCLYDVIGKPKIKPYTATPEADRRYTKAGALYANQRERDESPEEFRERLRESIIETPDRYFARGLVVRLEEDERDAAFDRWQVATAIREARRLGRWPRNPDACSKYGRTCAYFDVCCRTASLDDPLRFRREDRAHPELSAAIQQQQPEGDTNADS